MGDEKVDSDLDNAPQAGYIYPMPGLDKDVSVRFSCLDAAIQMHSAIHGPKESRLVLQTAQEFLDWIVPQITP